MPNIDVINLKGEKVEALEINPEIFDIEVNQNVVHDAVVNHLANKRQGTHSAKTRAEVRGGGRKPFRQKGTGRARQGSIRAPHYVGGGVTFAKKPRDYSYSLPKKVKRLALKSVLSDKFQNGKLVVVEDLNLEQIKTKAFVEILENINVSDKALFITETVNQNAYKSARNLEKVKTSFVGEINVYDIVNANTLVLTKETVKHIEEVYA